MKGLDFKKLIPHLFAILIFAGISAVFFYPELQGKKLDQGDTRNFLGMSKEVVDFREATDEEALWTNSMFGGMPAYQISAKFPKPVLGPLDSLFKIFSTGGLGTLFLYMIGFYILMLSLRIDPWLAVLGSIAFGFSSYFIILLEAGHNSKAFALGYMPAVVGGFILLFQQKKYLLGTVVTALFLGLQISSNHPQITYYMLLTIVILGVFYLVDSLRQGTFMHILKASALFIFASILALGMSASRLLTTAEYSPSTIRGASELTTGDSETASDGLDIEYATGWSYGIGESWTLLVPNFKGGGSGVIGSEKVAMDAVSPQNRQSLQGSVDKYWGDQPFTSGPVYVGAAIFLLFLIALWLVNGPLKWGLLSAGLLALILSWGKNFLGPTEFFMEYFPMYNKFRAVSMTLVIVELVIPLLAMVGLHKLIQERAWAKERIKIFYGISAGLTALLLLMYVSPSIFTDFFKSGELASYSDQLKSAGLDQARANSFLDDMTAARSAIFKADVMRSLIIVLLAAGLLWAFITEKIKSQYMIIGLGIVILADMWSVDRRYVTEENFKSKRELAGQFQPSPADQLIAKDKDPYFRVLNLTSRLDQDSRTSYFHKSLGGYHGAKLGRYQELIEGQLNKNNREVMNMLNTRYFITPDKQGQLSVVPNTGALGNAWFVNDLQYVADANEEMKALDDLNPANTVLIDERFRATIKGTSFAADSLASIDLISYSPKELKFKAKNNQAGFAVFSDIYYKPGWRAYIDGNGQEHVRVNYVLRGMEIPAGEHEVIFRFEPKSVATGNMIVYISSILLVLLMMFAAYSGLKPKKLA